MRLSLSLSFIFYENLCACSAGTQGFIQLWQLKVDQVTNITQTQPFWSSSIVTWDSKNAYQKH